MPITTPTVPEGLPELMRGLAKSVIKENPDNIYVHAAEYFENLIRERDGELDRGYKNFSAYKVYTDYKEKCRSKGGGNGSLSGGDIPNAAGGVAVRSRMASDGDDDSGGSASATRGRRKKRVRKQGSKDSNKSLERQESIESTTDAVNAPTEEKKSSSAESSRQESLSAIKEDSPDIEQAIVKVQAHLESKTPQERSINKSVSVDSVAAANAVCSVLQSAVEEADEADRETGEAVETQVEADLAEELGHPINCEDIDSYPPDDAEETVEAGNGDDYGSAPSTAEVAGEVVGDAEMLVNDSPPIENVESDVIENSQKNSDEVDLSVNDSAEKGEEPVTNGSAEVHSEMSTNVSVEKQESRETHSEGVDTVDADNKSAEEPVHVVEDVEEAVPNLPDVPMEEPSAAKTAGADDVQVDPIVGEPPEEEHADDVTKEQTVEDANITKSSEESSLDKIVESPAECDNKMESEACEDTLAAQEPPSNKTDSVEKEEIDEESSKSPPNDVPESNNNENEADSTSPTKSRSIENDTSAPPNNDIEKESSKDASKEGSIDKPADEIMEDSANPEESSKHVLHDNQDEAKSSDNGNQPEESAQPDVNPENGNEEAVVDPVDNTPENLESVENPLQGEEEASTDKNSDTAAEESKDKSGVASPVKASSVEQLDDPQLAPDEIPVGLPEILDSTEEPASEAVIHPEDCTPESATEAAEEVQPNKGTTPSGSAKASKEPSLDEPAPEVSVGSDQAEPEATTPSGSAKASKEPSLDEPEGEVSASSDQPKSSGSVKVEQAEPQLDESLDQPESGGSPQASKEPSQDKSESELNQSLDQSNADQSKESSVKESGGESASGEAVSGQVGQASIDAGEVSISSRMGDDEQEEESEQLPSVDNDNEEAVDKSKDEADAEEPSAPLMEEAVENDMAEENPKSDESKAEDEAPKEEDNVEKGPVELIDSEKCVKQSSEEADESKEEVVEEPCIQRQVSPSTSKIPRKQPSVELEEIKKVDLASFDKNSAEALFYTLKKSELENQESPSEANKTGANDNNGEAEEDDDDADVVVTEEPPPPVSRQATKRSFTDDFLENSPITDEVSKSAEGDGVADKDGADEDENQVFNPMLAASVRNKQLQDQLHSRYSQDDVSQLKRSPRKETMHRSMTERMDLSRQDTNYVDLRKYDPDYVEEEDQFDGYYIGNLKHKILASSVSVADSDYYDQAPAEGSIDDNNIQTALETIASTDTESTLPSQTTIQASKGYLKRSSQNTSTNIPYSSFGNNAINQSLDDFIEREEQLKEAEEQAASTIQRSYRRFRTNKKKLLRDYHSTMQTFTEDQSTESLEDYPGGVIQIKLDRKQPAESDNSFEDARVENSRRPMYSLNIDEYDTVARRMTLTRGVAMQRTSTPDEDSGKSNSTSGDKKSTSDPASNLTITEDSPVTSSDLSSEEKKSSTSSDEKENKDNSSSKSSEGRTAAVSAAALSDDRKSASLDVQKLFIARQRTMPVQIETSLLRAQPKHTRKRIKSAGMIRK